VDKLSTARDAQVAGRYPAGADCPTMVRATRVGPADADPFAPFDDLRLLLFHQAGVIGRGQARRLLTRAAIADRLARGDWSLAHRSVYVVGAADGLSAEQRGWVALLAVRSGRPAWLGGLSALAAHGLDGFHSPDAHVLIPTHCRAHDPPIFAVVHRTGFLAGDELYPYSAPLAQPVPPCTAIGRSVVDAAQWAGSDAMAAAIVAGSLRQRLSTLAQIEAALARQPRAHRRRLTLDVARDASGATDALPAAAHPLPEREFMRLCRRAGLPVPKCQVSNMDPEGTRRYLDACFEEYAVTVEIDGAQHVDVRDRWADRCRHSDLWMAGDQVLRFPSWLVRHRPAEVGDQVHAALVGAGWDPRAGNRRRWAGP
jgi:hypothetical protein